MEKLLEIKDLKKVFTKNKKDFVAVNSINFDVYKGECLGIVGESGCGKSTTAKMITRLMDKTEGEILLEGKEISSLKGRAQRELYRDIQMVFQTPQDSFDPRRKLSDGIIESMINHGVSRSEAKARMLELVELVELTPELVDRFPHQVSGGQCQRAAIARALAINPKLLICDEATSALDVTVQAQIVQLLKKLQKELGLTIMLICHDLALVQALCDRVIVMYNGEIVESGTPDDVIRNPKEDYTKNLVDSVL